MSRSAAVVSGVTPLTSPPSFFESFDPKQLGGYDLLFFKLHGLEGQDRWYGDDRLVAITADQIRQANLKGSMVFAASCFGLGSPLVTALSDAGAETVIAGAELNTAGINRLIGSDVIAYWWRKLLLRGLRTNIAFRLGQIAAASKRPILAPDIYSFQLLGNKEKRLSR